MFDFNLDERSGDRSCFNKANEPSYPQSKPLKQVNVKYSSEYNPSYSAPKQPEEDPQVQQQKRLKDKMIDDEKERRRITYKEAIKKMFRDRLLKNGLKKAAGGSVETINYIMEDFFRDKLRRLVQICRADQTKFNELMSSNRIGVPLGHETTLKVNTYQVRNKYLDVKDNEHVVPYTNMSWIYTNDTKGQLTQTDEERMKVIQEKKEKIQKLKAFKQQKYKKGKRGRKKQGEGKDDQEEKESDDDDMDDMDDEDDSDSPTNRNKPGHYKSGSKANYISSGNMFDVNYENTDNTKIKDEGGARVNTLNIFTRQTSGRYPVSIV